MIETTVNKQYNGLASVYDRRWKKYISHTLSFLKNWAEISPLDTVLDVACGTGEFEKLLLTENSTLKIVGVDISEKMLAIAQEKCKIYPQVSFHTASASALPFADNSFDVIVSASSFHYFNDPLAALIEMKRVLKPNGKVVILDWCKDYLFCQILDIILKIFDPAHQQCYTQEEFHSFLTCANFVISRATKVRFGLFWGLMVATAQVGGQDPLPPCL
ncbi:MULTISPECIES: class I SAM-dependent methyltransferase [Nostoc]|uniref:Methyltransferase domain-containing protein n=1 Tax=Nostoc paludosum FACHB-159 TaxID=2692908 RepID=A0ABR8KEU7_9NOSO|nr:MULTISPECIES: methyltransferase domain-containing protein [Nostoc]MBD2679398.1 methyltransferase domain-containing protein [Nostoc sp. FACHB-857]MBD2737244.1 methyltransferase domain-containing protein [Nostoc paludosum FACHB-159]